MTYSKAFKKLSAQKIMFLGVFLRILVAIWNGFFGPSYGAGADAINTYHKTAVNWLDIVLLKGFKIGLVYSYALGIFYDLVGDSLFLGSLLSCFAWLLSALILIKVMRLLSFNTSNQCKAMLIFALLPSSILFTSVTLKEVYQLLFVNLAVYSSLKIFLDKSDRYWLLLLCAAISMSVLHPTFYVFGLFMVNATLMSYFFRLGNKAIFKKIILIVPLVVLVSYFGFQYKYIFNIGTRPASVMGSSTANATGSSTATVDLSNLADAVESFQRGGLGYINQARTFYKTSVNFHGISGLLSSIPLSLFQYLFEPMPWRISAIVDIEAVSENILRAGLIWMALVGLLNISGYKRIPVLFIFLSYLAIETIWSLGTINWGTAIRHHIPALGLLVVAAFAPSGKRITKNGALKTIEGFGDEWTRFDQSSISEQERTAIFNSYFSIFPWNALPVNSEGFDLGCGSGRWAKLVAPRVGTLHCIDPSSALEVARKNLTQFKNCKFHSATVDTMPLKDKSMDFGYSLGVLHHILDTQAALAACVKKLKPGAPFLAYLYYAFDNKPWWFRIIWRISNVLRCMISKFPFWLRYVTSQVIAFLVYLPLAKVALVLERIGLNASNFPLSAYRNRSFYTMRTDALDRFGTRVEQRFTRNEIENMMEKAGLESIEFSNGVPFWCAVGYRK